MPSLGLSLALPRTAGTFYDPDALSYFAAASITDPIGKEQINTFVRGIKSLGLYNNMVAWPLRSTQNAGTGTTAYSLGGLGTYDGTLTNDPTWGTGGITFDGTDDYIQTGFASGLSEFSIFSVTTSNSTGVRYEYSKDFVTSNREFGVFQQANGITNFFVRNSSGLIQTPAGAYTTDCKLHCFRASSSVNKLRRNNGSDVTGTTGTLTQGTTSLRFGALAALVPTSFFIGSISSVILFNTALTDSQTSAVYYLYQSTLGAGLGLPDADASAYIARAGVTDTTGQQQINDFVVGVKKLGLYNNMVAWPLRSTQNAGTGVTAYSLGGLGTYDGTLTGPTGLPTWGTTGITFDGVDDYIDTTLGTVQPELTAISVSTPTGTSTAWEITKSNLTTSREFEIAQVNSFSRLIATISGVAVSTVGNSYSPGDCRFVCARMSESFRKIRTNNRSDTSATGSTRPSLAVNVRIGADSGIIPVSFPGVIHSSILFNKALTDSETDSMYALYQSTLGAGLGLPEPSQTFYRNFAANKALNLGLGPNISFTRASAANYFNSAGVLTSAAVNEPRFDHDPVTLASKGLLVEVQRTNLALRSAELSDAAWNKTTSPVTVTADQIAAPDGTTSGDLIAATTDSDDHLAYQPISGATAGAVYTMSIFVKQGTQRYIIFGDRGDAVWRLLTFDFNTLSISGTFNLTSSSVTSVGNGWYRLTATATRTNTSSYQIAIGFGNSATHNSPPVYVASASDNFYAWGAQLEEGAFASSYIGTAGASATRSSDLPTVTAISSFYNQDEGTIFVQQSQAVINHTTSFRFLEISNAGAAFRKPIMEIQTNNVATFSTLGGTTTGVSNSSNTVSANTVYKIACAYKTNDLRGALNGTLTSADTTVDVATPVVDRMTIGYSTSIPSFQVSCHIQKIAYYNTRLTDAQMQSLTT